MESFFGVWDYLLFAGLFVVSCGIGLLFAVKDGRKRTSSSSSTRDFLTGGRRMTFGPVALSLTTSFMSAVTVIGSPADVYRFGASFVLFGVAYAVVTATTAEVFLPVFYRSGITSVYEYLELRFCRVVRLSATLIYMIQTILYTGIVVYAPALALNQVTGFSLWGSIAATGVVCTFYCTVGGMKAVVWSDVFQMLVMVVGFVAVLAQGSRTLGGLQAVWGAAHNGSRLTVFDFDPSPLRRHTFWTLCVGGTFTWLGIYGVNQSVVQRCISCRTESHARLALYINLLGLWLILFCSVLSGLIMYAFYAQCDPWTSGRVSAPDQIMPYFVMEILGGFPGLPGLFVAAVFSATLSTVAASINALATVTYEDFVRPCCVTLSHSDASAPWISKGLCLLFGAACTSMAVLASYMGALIQAALSIHGMCGGPMLGLFTLGIIFPWSNSKGAVGGLLTGIGLTFWTRVGSLLYPALAHSSRPLALSTAGCQPHINTTVSSAADDDAMMDASNSTARPLLAETWYCMSYLHLSTLGFTATVAMGTLISILTGANKGKDVNPLLLRPAGGLSCFKNIRRDNDKPAADRPDISVQHTDHQKDTAKMAAATRPTSGHNNAEHGSYSNAAFTTQTLDL